MEIIGIAGMGTSLTAGSASDGNYQPSTARSLVPGKSQRARFFNFGIPGGTSVNGIASLPRVLAVKPVYCLIEYQTNDCSTGPGGLSEAESEANTIQILDELREAGIVPYLMTMNPMIDSGLDFRANLPTYNEIYRDLAVSESVGLIDVYPLWGTPTAEQIPDGIHPTLTAVRAVLVPALRDVLAPLIT